MLLLLFAAPSLAQAADTDETFRVRIEWGGGSARKWRGTIWLDKGTFATPTPLGVEPDSPGAIALEDGQIEIREPAARTYDGLDVTVVAPLDARLVVRLTEESVAEGEAPPDPIEVPLADLVSGIYDKPVDNRNNWLMVRRSPGDQLRVRMDYFNLIFAPGAPFKLEVEPYQLNLKPGTHVNFEVQLRASRGGTVINTQNFPQVVTEGTPALAKIPLEFLLPREQGAYEVVIQASVRKLKFSTAIGRNMLREIVTERKVQVVVLDPVARPDLSMKAPRVTTVDEISPTLPGLRQKLTSLPLLPTWRRTGPLAEGEAAPWKYSLGDRSVDLVRVGPAGRPPALAWQAYPLRVITPGVPHVLEVEYPANMPQTMGISIVEPNAAGDVIPIGLDSGVHVPNDATDLPPRLEVHRVIFWPRTTAPVVLLTNRRDGAYALFGKLRVLEGRLPYRGGTNLEESPRLIAGQFDRPFFAETFGATQTFDPASHRSLKDWGTFLEGSTRLADYLKYAGYNALFLPAVCEGAALYPSEHIESTARFDTGSFFASGQDPMPKDVLELVFQVFDREKLRLIPGVQFSAPLAKLETQRRELIPGEHGLELVGSDGRTWAERNGSPGGVGPYYNPLDPRVQQAMINVVGELAARYAEHASFAGLSVDLSAQGYAQFPGVAWGLDDETIARFEQEAVVNVPGEGPSRFAARARELSGPLAARWLAWRAKKLAEFHRQLQTELTRHRPGARLYLTTAHWLSNLEAQRELRRSVPQGIAASDVLLTMGIDPGLYREDRGPVLFRPQQIGPIEALSAGPLTQEMNAAPELDLYFRQASLAASQFYHPPLESRLPSFDERSPFKSSSVELWSQTVPSGEFNRRRFAHSLATLDAQIMCDGGRLLPMGQEASTELLLAGYRQLPAVPFETFAEATQPVTIRTSRDARKSYIYLVNDSPWKVPVRMRLDVPVGCHAEGLGGRTLPQLFAGGQAEWTLTLEPYDMIAARFTSPAVQLLQAEALVSDDIRVRMELEAEDLEARLAALVRLDSGGAAASHVVWNLTPQLLNAGFEQPRGLVGEIPGWKIPQRAGVEVRLDADTKYSGRQSAVLKSSGPVATLAGPTFEAPETGRLLMSVWLRVSDPSVQPPLRLALEGRLDGRPYYRFAAVGQGVQGAAISKTWRSYLFRVDDLPLTGLTQLGVRFDLMGPGEVWIDEVQVSSVILSQPELFQLQKTVATARFALEKHLWGDGRRLLDSYWPRFLVRHVAPVDLPARESVRDDEGLAPQAAKRDVPPAVEKKPAGWLDRVWLWK